MFIKWFIFPTKWFILPSITGITGYLFAIEKYIDIAYDTRKEYLGDIKHVTGRSLMHGNHRALSEEEVQSYLNNDIRAIERWKQRSYLEKLLFNLPINSLKPKMMTHSD